MIEFKNPLVRVRCLECSEEHFIEMKHIETDKEQRSMGFEYEHTYRGKLKCSHCGEDMKLFKTIWEYPKGIINYHETKNESCLVIDDITDDSLNVSDVMDSITLSKSEIWLINTLKFDINDILIAREQKKNFTKEWQNKLKTQTEQLDLFVPDSLPSRDSIRKIIELTAHDCNGDVWGDDIPLGTMDELIDAALKILCNENPKLY